MRNASAYDDFYRSTSPRLLRYCYALTGELGEAQDVAQETYMRAWRHWNVQCPDIQRTGGLAAAHCLAARGPTGGRRWPDCGAR